MRITVGQLRRIIKEEVQNALPSSTAYVINLYISDAERETRKGNPLPASRGLSGSDFSAAESAELKAAIESVGGKMRLSPGSVGGPAGSSIAVRGNDLFFDTKEEALAVADEIISSLSPELASRVQPGVIPTNRKQ